MSLLIRRPSSLVLSCRLFSFKINNVSGSRHHNPSLSLPIVTRAQSTSSLNPSFDLYSAACIERLPRITPELNIIQKAMKELLEKHEANQGLYAEHELTHIEDLKRTERLASKTGEVDEKDVEMVGKQTAQDYEDKGNQELAAFSFADTVTEADKSGDKKSLERCLDRHLLLLTKFAIGDKDRWLVPHVKHTSGEEGSLRETAEQALEQFFGKSIFPHITIMGNAPASVYSYRYPNKIRSELEGRQGGRIFFFKVKVKNPDKLIGHLQPTSLVKDYSWLTREEAGQLLREEGNDRYWKQLSASLLSEGVDEKTIQKIIEKIRRQGVRLSSTVYRKKSVKQ